MMMKLITSLTIVFFLSSFSKRDLFFDPLKLRAFEIYKNNSLIKTYKIRSLTIFTEYIDNADNSGKTEEAEFDENGNQIYRVISSNQAILGYYRDEILWTATYNEDNQPLRTYKEYWTISEETLMKYDLKLALITTEFFRKDESEIKIVFDWKDGKIANVNISPTADTNKVERYEYNAEGKIIHSQIGEIKRNYTYENYEDSVKTIISEFHVDTLYMTERYTTLTKIDQKIHYLKTNHLNKKEKEMKARFDKFGNIVYYYVHLTKPEYLSYDPDIHDLTAEFKINNHYNKQGLLKKRTIEIMYYDTSEDKTRIVETFFYDEEPLIYRMKEGDVNNINNPREIYYIED